MASSPFADIAKPHPYNRSHSSASVAPLAVPHTSHTSSPAPPSHPSLHRSQSQHTNLPTPSREPASATVSKSNNWHFPGPSSKYHTRSYSRPDLQQRKSSTSTTIPIAPSFATDKRVNDRAAQRRSYTAANVLPTTEGADGRAHKRKERDKRSPLTRFSSSETASMAQSKGSRTPVQPVTPASKTTGLGLLGAGMWFGGGKRVQDSPFSDYFTDDGRSPGFSSSSEPRKQTETQRLLLRLNEVGALVMRAGEREERGVGEVIERKVRELEEELGGLRGQRGWRGEDSLSFMDEEEDGQNGNENDRIGATKTPFDASTVDASGLLTPPSTSPTKATIESDKLLKTARDVLTRVSFANENLRSRHEELQSLHDKYAAEIEDRDQTIEVLRAENEQLRSDVGFGRSELLSLKFQLEASDFENQGSGSARRGHEMSGQGTEQSERGTQNVRQGWKDIEARFRSRNGEVGGETMSDPGVNETVSNRGGWTTIAVQREGTGNGRVQAISAMRRLKSQLNDVANEESDTVESVEALGPGPERYADTLVQTDTAARLLNHGVADAGEDLEGEEAEPETAERFADTAVQTDTATRLLNHGVAGPVEDLEVVETEVEEPESYVNANVQTATASRLLNHGVADSVEELEIEETKIEEPKNYANTAVQTATASRILNHGVAGPVEDLEFEAPGVNVTEVDGTGNRDRYADTTVQTDTAARLLNHGVADPAEDREVKKSKVEEIEAEPLMPRRTAVQTDTASRLLSHGVADTVEDPDDKGTEVVEPESYANATAQTDTTLRLLNHRVADTVETWEAEEPEVNGKQVKEPEIEERQVEEPQVEEPEADESEIEDSEIEESEVEGPEIAEPMVDESKVREQDIEDPEIRESELEEPETGENEIEEPEDDAKPNPLVTLPNADPDVVLAEDDAPIDDTTIEKALVVRTPRKVAVVLEPEVEVEERQIIRSKGKRKSAWQELWEGLGQLAGMGETEGSSEDGE